jgi:predicted RNase H-like HicB family nuclease
VSTREYLIVIEKANGNYSAYAPDLPGCVATGATRRQAEKNMRSAIAMHLDGLREDKMAMPLAHSSVAYFDIATRPRAGSNTRKSKTSPARAKR